ncbi:cinnamoyl-CoA reductase-like SNL6 isoform X2 [Nicotiana tabacum]|uniref:Cinnamoyl-CoA reductase 1 isoform X2 n=1 Tax=Nicotiana tabacum TaxID=4097 RepID=A0A1S4BXW2_TOBAC|nr:PREDICTED: cinnamoyl-CoA reductase 1 isoform X2 [Nicotiana tabacum]
MGIVCPDESKRIEIEEFRRMLLSYAAVHRTKAAAAAAAADDDEFRNPQQLPTAVQQNRELEEKKVCVTSGVSFLGIAIVNQLLLRGYSVRVIVEKQEDLEKLREMEITGEMRQSKSSTVEAVMANLNDVQSLSEAFNGCRGVFHTAAFVDPAGLSGYSLWYALGKLKAERVAWNVAKESGFKLATICPGLVTGPDFLSRNPTSTIAYLKGAQEMFRNGLLATVDVNRLAISHVLVFEEMKNTASGRYISFERVIRSEEDFEKLARETGTEIRTSTNSIIGASNTHRIGIKLSNAKLCRLMSATFRCNS